MASKHNALLLFLLLSALQEMVIMRGEATTCEGKSTLYRGACWNPNNCGTICEKEGFSSGKCKFLKCVCLKDCGIPHGGLPSHAPPAGGPPSNETPAEGPPSDETPAEGTPTEDPPSEETPEEGPPTEGEPDE